MAILTCTKVQCLAITGNNANRHKQDTFRGVNVAAFGAEHPVGEKYLAVDAFALLLRDDLGKSIGAKVASSFVRAFADQWQEAVARCEFGDVPYVWAIGEMFQFGRGREQTAWWSAAGPTQSLPAFVKDKPGRLVVANIPALMTRLRERAAEAGLDWSPTAGSFYVPPDHELHVEWAREFKRRRDAAIRNFDPLHSKIRYGGLSAKQRKAIEALIE